MRVPAQPAPPPDVLEVKGRTRYVWLLGWLGGAVVATMPTVTEYFGASGTLWDSIWIKGVTVLICGGVAVRGFQRGIKADRTGVTVVNFFRQVVIPWHQLEDLDFKRIDTEAFAGLYYKLDFRWSGRKIVAEAPAGGSAAGQYLHQLRETLLTMRTANTSMGAAGQALPAAQKQGPPPHPDTLPRASSDEESLREDLERQDPPEDPPVGVLGHVVAGGAFLLVLAPMVYVAWSIPDWLGVSNDDYADDISAGVMPFAIVPALLAWELVAGPFTRHHLAREANR